METGSEQPLIALISATPAAIAPAQLGFAESFPEARLWNILDDLLLSEAQRRGSVDGHLTLRMRRLIDHAVAEGASGVLLTCSMYGDVAHAYQSAALPVLASDDAAFEAVADGNYRAVLVIGSFDAASRDAEARLAQFLAARGQRPQITSVVAPSALEAVQQGDDALLREAVERCAAPLADQVDAVLLAQYSLAPVAGWLGEKLGRPVYCGPASAAAQLRTIIQADGDD